jgi:hypothetical protein
MARSEQIWGDVRNNDVLRAACRLSKRSVLLRGLAVYLLASVHKLKNTRRVLNEEIWISSFEIPTMGSTKGAIWHILALHVQTGGSGDAR